MVAFDRVTIHVRQKNDLDEIPEPGGEALGALLCDDCDEPAMLEWISAEVKRSFEADHPKPTLADLMRLVELRREFGKSAPEPLKVGWVEEWPDSSEE